MIEPPVKQMLILMNESDLWQDRPLYEALMRRLQQLGVAGATVYKGIMGMGSHHKVHHKGLFGVSEDPPVSISIFDNESRLRELAPKLREMAPESLMILLDVEVLL